ncbi:acetylserotonin O-methyltransferase [Streptomyces sp. JH002]|uniref:methyltransferase n=1 Tax=Streptomyces TaxID=1883 RepID=UPI003688DF14
MPLTGTAPELSPAEVEAAQHAQALYQMTTAHWITQVVRAAAVLRVADHIADGARTAEEIAERESSHPGATHRLLRACASIGLLAHEGGGRFDLTPVGALLRDGVPGSLRDAALLSGAPAHWQVWQPFPEAVREGRPQWERALGSDLFTYLAQHPEDAELFSRAMNNATEQVVQDTVALLDLDGAARIADIGGADGALVLGLMAEHAHLEGVVFDLPHALPAAEAAAKAAGVAERFEAVAGDFFESVPQADYYLLKWVLHDWSDEQCVRILRNCREAARPGGRILVIEALLGETGSPDPVALLDMNMLSVSAGQERSLEAYDALFAEAGWKRTGLRPTRSMFALIELERLD